MNRRCEAHRCCQLIPAYLHRALIAFVFIGTVPASATVMEAFSPVAQLPMGVRAKRLSYITDVPRARHRTWLPPVTGHVIAGGTCSHINSAEFEVLNSLTFPNPCLKVFGDLSYGALDDVIGAVPIGRYADHTIAATAAPTSVDFGLTAPVAELKSYALFGIGIGLLAVLLTGRIYSNNCDST